jgi:hypothetical protein
MIFVAAFGFVKRRPHIKSYSAMCESCARSAQENDEHRFFPQISG